MAQDFHYYGSTVYGWAVAETRDKVAKMLAQDCGSRIIKSAVRDCGGVSAVICRVPLPKAAHYSINNFMPEFIAKEDGVNETRKGERIECSEIEKVRLVNMQGRTIPKED